MTRLVVALGMLLAALPALAGGDVALVGAVVHVGDGQVRNGATVLVRGGVISDVGVVPVPDGVPVVDLTGRHLAPGFIAADTVLGLTEIGAVRATRDDSEVGTWNAHVRAWSAVNPDSELLPVAMANGVLHAVVAPRGGVVSGTSAVMRLKGWTREDMVVKGPAALHVAWPSMSIDRSKGAKVPAAEQVERRDAALRELSDFFADARAYLEAESARREGRAPRADRDARFEAMAPVLSREVPVVANVTTLAEARAAMDLARRHDVRLILSGCGDCWRMADEIAAAQVPVIVQPVRALPARDFEPYDVRFAAPAILRAAGVTVCMSVGRESFAAPHVRNLPDEAAMGIAFGLPPEEALRAITLAPAETFGVADRLGSVSPGKRGDLVAWDGPPLEITSRVTHVFLGGEEVAVESRQERLYRKYAARPRPGRVAR